MMRCAIVPHLVSSITTERIIRFLILIGILFLFVFLYVGLVPIFDEPWNTTYWKFDKKNLTGVIKDAEFISDDLPHELTIVTAYFNLGTFQKGNFQTFSTNTYKKWMKSYGMLNNTVIMYTDSEDIAYLIQESREHFPEHMTKVVQLDRKNLWAFKLAPKIKDIFDQPGYPHYAPNTVNENYSCAMHVKYELLDKVIRERLYKTKYIAWVDIGYFRQHQYRPFKLLPPKVIRYDHISFVQIQRFNSSLSPPEIITGNYVWLAGGFFIGRPEYLLIFIEDYKKAVLQLIDQKWMSTDQQVLYSMFSKATKLESRIPLQTYSHHCKCDWFYLGEICREQWEKGFRKNVSKLINFLFWSL